MTPDDILDMALDIEEAIRTDESNALMPTVAQPLVESAPNMVQINHNTDQTANFNLEIPGFNWQQILQLAKPNINISNCNVTLHLGSEK